MWHCGELLAQVAPQGGGDYRSSGRQRPKGRGAAATAAGLSERQRKTALRVHSIPRAEFNELIEAEPPATENQSAGSGPLIGQQRLAMPEFRFRQYIVMRYTELGPGRGDCKTVGRADAGAGIYLFLCGYLFRRFRENNPGEFRPPPGKIQITAVRK